MATGVIVALGLLVGLVVMTATKVFNGIRNSGIAKKRRKELRVVEDGFDKDKKELDNQITKMEEQVENYNKEHPNSTLGNGKPPSIN